MSNQNNQSYSLKASPNISPNRSVSPLNYATKSPNQQYYAQRTPEQQTQKKAPQQFNQSPQPDLSRTYDEADLWRSRCNDLETSLCQANTDLELANFKAKKARELEEKVDTILKHNAHLLGENDMLAKQFGQKKTESDIWKAKYEQQMNNIINIKAGYELDIKKLQGEVARLREQLDRANCEKVADVENTKSKILTDSFQQIDSLKRQHTSNMSLYEEQFRNLKRIVEDREKEISVLQGKVAHAINEGELEAARLNEDRERLRHKISELELENQHNLEIQKQKLDSQTAETLDNLRKLHENELEVLEGELNKLKHLLEIKNNEIDTLIQQNKSQKNNFTNENDMLRSEIQHLKMKIAENNIGKENEINDLKDKFAALHTTDIEGLKYHHENQVQALQDEIEKLHDIIDKKNHELENTHQEKQKQREDYRSEVRRLTEHVDDWKTKHKHEENEKHAHREKHKTILEQTQKQHDDFSTQQKQQIEFLEGEIGNLRDLLTAKQNEIDKQIQQHNTIKNGLEIDLKNQIMTNEEWRKKFNALDHEKYLITEELRMKCNVLENQMAEMQRKLEGTIEMLDNELKRTRDTLAIKSHEADNHLAIRNEQEQKIRNLKNEIDNLTKHILHLERLKNQELEDLRIKLETSNNFGIAAIKATHQNKENVLNSEIMSMKSCLDAKDREISELLQMYEHLQRAYGAKGEDQLQDYANRRADTATNKDLYDVFLKSKKGGSGIKDSSQ